MTSEEALKRIQEIEKNNGLEPNSLLTHIQGLAKEYNISLEELANGMPLILISVGQTKPIRIKKTSCKNCKYYVEIPPLLGLSDIFATEEKEPIRLCDIDRLGEPILGDKWQHGCACFNPKTKRKLKESENEN